MVVHFFELICFVPFLKIVLEQYSDALATFLAVANGVKAIAVTQHNFKTLVFWRKSQATANPGLPVASLLIAVQIVHMRRGGFQPEFQAMIWNQRNIISAVKMFKSGRGEFFIIITG